MKRTRRTLLLAVTAAALLTACSAGAPTALAPSSAAAPETATPDAASAATAYLLETPEFALRLPAEPEMSTQPIPDFPGVDAVLYTSEIGATVTGVSLFDYPPDVTLAEPTTLLEGSRDGALSNLGGTLVSSSATTVDGRPALDFAGDVQGADYLCRLVLDDRRIYQVITTGEEDRTAEHAAIAGSLRLT